jgi:tellurite resistance protein TerC
MGLPTVGSPLLWIVFVGLVAAFIAVDLLYFSRKAHEISLKEAAAWSAFWVALSLGFAVFVFVQWGSELGQAFLAGYALEKALSVDNLFVFYAIFTAFSVPPMQQHRLLTWGILGALVLRAAMILGGSWLLGEVAWIGAAFGVVLIASGARMLSRPGKEPHPERSRVYRWVRRVIPTTLVDHGQKLFVTEDGRIRATPFFLVLLMIEATDFVFAVDSILAVFAVSADPFIVFTSNVFAVMGLRALYFLMSGMAHRFRYLQPGLALVLVFVGAKMALAEWLHVPVLVSLFVILGLVGGSIAASAWKTRREARLGRPPIPPLADGPRAVTQE